LYAFGAENRCIFGGIEMGRTGHYANRAESCSLIEAPPLAVA